MNSFVKVFIAVIVGFIGGCVAFLKLLPMAMTEYIVKYTTEDEQRQLVCLLESVNKRRDEKHDSRDN